MDLGGWPWNEGALVFSRAIGLLAFLPFGEEGFAQRVKFGLAVVLTACAVPTQGGLFEGSGTDATVSALLWEFFLGAAIGFPLGLTVELYAMAGEVFDVARGQNLAGAYDPAFTTQASATSTVLRYGALAYLSAAGALTVLVSAFLRSVQHIPPGLVDREEVLRLATLLLGTSGIVMRELVMSLFPFLVVFLLIELSFGFLTKVFPQLSLQQEALVAKSLAGFFLALLLVSRGVTLPAVPDLLRI